MLNSLIRIIKEDIVGTENRWIAMAWLASIAAIVGVGVYLSSESMSFLGVADSRELQINFEYPVSVKRIHVLPGQSVQKGDLLLELDHSDLNSQIRLLKGQKSRLEAEVGVRQDLNKIVGNSTADSSTDPLTVDLRDLSEQLVQLEKQKQNLFVFAEVSGLVGAVNFKKGEKAPSFAALITLTPTNPSYVQGFLHENIKTKLAVGGEVLVKPLTSGAPAVQGRVVAVGARMVLMPQRMVHVPGAQIWGREVIVEIPEHNSLLIGERVQIKPEVSWVGIPMALAADKEASAGDVDRTVLKMKMPSELASRISFEPSGAVYLADLKKFLIVSDDTDKADKPMVFLMNPDGEIEEEPMMIPGVDQVKDLESVSAVGNTVYLMSGQGLSKKGKNQASRNLFIKTTRSGLTFSDTKTVELREMLIKAIQSSKDERLATAFKGLVPSEFEIESHYINNGDLFVGIKGPLADKSDSIILKIANVESIFETKKIADISVARILRLELNGTVHRLTDFALIGGHLYATTSCKSKKCGAVWKLADSQNPDLLAFYDGVQPEGLAHDPVKKSLLVTFDGKNSDARFSHAPMLPSADSKPQASITK